MTASRKPAAALALAALGVVFGDIGTSPLYAVKVIFGRNGPAIPIDALNVEGIISLILWTVAIVVSVKYLGFVMGADNKGEGGIMALVARVRSAGLSRRAQAILVLLGLGGVALFYGDSSITPAISVLSAVEGLQVVTGNASQYILPVTILILVLLFWLQRYGTAVIGKLFGPVMLLWFGAMAVGGLSQVLKHPGILRALLPTSAWDFVRISPSLAFVAMGAVVLAVTGAEALYADMGHFGRRPIARAWFMVVFPALILSYMGQGALVLNDRSTTANPFYLMFPTALHLPMIALATLATLIASQSVISGAFSLTRQAVQLGFLPRMRVIQTSNREHGQIYIPSVNMMLLVVVIFLVVYFGSSERLAGAYGVAVSGALAVDTLLFAAIMLPLWRGTRRLLYICIGGFLLVDAALVTATVPKVLHGGWLPLLLALGVLMLIDSWRRGETIVRAERRTMEGPLRGFVAELHEHKLRPLMRIPGQAVFIGHHPGYTPMALHDAVDNLHELPEQLVIVYVLVADAAHVPEEKRAVFDALEYVDGISQVTLTFGFHDLPNVPHALNQLRALNAELDFDPYKAPYFISLTRAVPTRRRNMPGWQKSLYVLMDRLKLSTSDYYKLPIAETSEVRTLIKL